MSHVYWVTIHEPQPTQPHTQYPKRPRINSEICKHLNLRLWILHYWLRFTVPTALVCPTLWTLYFQIGECPHDRQSDHFTTLTVSYIFRADTIHMHGLQVRSHRRLTDKSPTEISFMRPTASQWFRGREHGVWKILKRERVVDVWENRREYLLFLLSATHASRDNDRVNDVIWHVTSHRFDNTTCGECDVWNQQVTAALGVDVIAAADVLAKITSKKRIGWKNFMFGFIQYSAIQFFSMIFCWYHLFAGTHSQEANIDRIFGNHHIFQTENYDNQQNRFKNIPRRATRSTQVPLRHVTWLRFMRLSSNESSPEILSIFNLLLL